MSQAKSQNAILWIQTLGCLGIVLVTWLDEWLGLPGLLFRGPAQPPNWREAAMETLVVLVAWSIMTLISRRLVRRLRYLEDLQRVCAWCRKIDFAGRWVPMERYFAEGLGTETSHGICPACAEAQLATLGRPHERALGRVRPRASS